ncbi:MAG: carbonic anhydrase [Candidatus Aadella gelida]|nr:carbonic anhydrase [Candidatus Aadella gelida]
MKRLISIQSKKDIPIQYQDTPIGLLFEYHNFGRPDDVYSNPQLLISMCMDNRKRIHIPDNFSFIIRTGGSNLRYSEFKVSYAISVGGVRHLVLIGHTQCGMVDLMSQKEQFVQGLVERAGWTRQAAEEHFTDSVPIFEIGNAVDFVLNETKRLKLRYSKIEIVPLMYRVEDNLLYMIKEDQ